MVETNGHEFGFPPRTVDLLVLVLSIFNSSNVDASLVGKDDAAGNEPLVASKNDRVQHGLVEEEIPHPLAHDDVDLLNRELNLLDLALDAFDTLRRGNSVAGEGTEIWSVKSSPLQPFKESVVTYDQKIRCRR